VTKIVFQTTASEPYITMVHIHIAGPVTIGTINVNFRWNPYRRPAAAAVQVHEAPAIIEGGGGAPALAPVAAHEPAGASGAAPAEADPAGDEGMEGGGGLEVAAEPAGDEGMVGGGGLEVAAEPAGDEGMVGGGGPEGEVGEPAAGGGDAGGDPPEAAAPAPVPGGAVGEDVDVVDVAARVEAHRPDAMILDTGVMGAAPVIVSFVSHMPCSESEGKAV
jgi:hypothetical protein